MTCFWDGIMKQLDNSDFELLSSQKEKNKHFILLLKKNNKLVNDVKWNGKYLKEQEQKEHFEAIKDYDENKINRGYLCSTCDSFLLLISSLFRVNIHHRYMKTIIKYSVDKSRKTLHFKSNRNHFS